MKIQRLLFGEFHSAGVAKIQNFGAMNRFLMFLQVCFPEELLLAFRTFVTLTVLVQNNVIFQMSFLEEGSMTDITLELLFPRVFLHVSCHIFCSD